MRPPTSLTTAELARPTTAVVTPTLNRISTPVERLERVVAGHATISSQGSRAHGYKRIVELPSIEQEATLNLIRLLFFGVASVIAPLHQHASALLAVMMRRADDFRDKLCLNQWRRFCNQTILAEGFHVSTPSSRDQSGRSFFENSCLDPVSSHQPITQSVLSVISQDAPQT